MERRRTKDIGDEGWERGWSEGDEGWRGWTAGGRCRSGEVGIQERRAWRGDKREMRCREDGEGVERGWLDEKVHFLSPLNSNLKLTYIYTSK